METIHTKFNDSRIIDEIRKGEVVSFPTETVYGVGCIYDNNEAFEKLVKAKNRRPDKPFSLMLGNTKDITKYAYVDSYIQKLIDTFMPGEITLLLKPREGLFPWVTLGSKYIGVRVPDYKEVCSLINNVGKPMLVTSANMSGDPVCKDFNEVTKVFDGRISLIVEGLTRSSKPSTIIICDKDITLVREGSITFEEITKVWEEK